MRQGQEANKTARSRESNVRALCEDGWTPGEIAAELGIHEDSVIRIKRRLGLTKKRARQHGNVQHEGQESTEGGVVFCAVDFGSRNDTAVFFTKDEHGQIMELGTASDLPVRAGREREPGSQGPRGDR